MDEIFLPMQRAIGWCHARDAKETLFTKRYRPRLVPTGRLTANSASGSDDVPGEGVTVVRMTVRLQVPLRVDAHFIDDLANRVCVGTSYFTGSL